jgi:hypothetical protein
VKVKRYPIHDHEGWWLDREALKKQISPRTRAVIAVNPNNPTGSFIKPGELDGVELPIICDEVFRDYRFEGEPYRLSGAYIVNGISKLLGLPQMKLGWIVVPDEASMPCLELIADTYLSVSAPIQHAAARWLEMRESFHARMMERLRSNRAFLDIRVEGGWYAILRLPRTRPEEDWCLSFLEEDDVLVQPGYFYDFESEPFIVVSLLTPPQIFQEGIQRIWKKIASER